MKFQLPQFIETEIKIIGPFTLKQFLWIAGGVSLIALEYVSLSGIIFWILAVFSGAFFAALAFVKINDMPLINYIAYALAYSLNPKKYVFRAEEQKDITPPAQKQP